jgi:hypothetical protein
MYIQSPDLPRGRQESEDSIRQGTEKIKAKTKDKQLRIFILLYSYLGAPPRRGGRAIRLYLFCRRQKRIPLLSLALLKNGLRAVFEL